MIAWTADVGQGEELEPLDEKARATGASKCVIEDLREEFVRDFVYPAIRTNAIYEGLYLLGTSLARPIIGRKLTECAIREGADAICHGATGKGNDQVRFELTAYAFKPDIKIIAPCELGHEGRRDLMDCLTRCANRSTVASPALWMDLYHISYEGGILEDP